MPARWVVAWRDVVYLRLQPVVTTWSGAVPFALLDLLLGAVLLALVFVWTVRVARAPRRARGRALWSALAITVVGASALYVAFVGTWGLNYRHPPLAHALDHDPARVTSASVARLASIAAEQLNVLHGPAHARPWPRRRELPESLGPAFATAQRLLGTSRLAVPAPPKPTLLAPYFRRSAVAGMVDPFFLEVLVTPDALPFELPAILAHEWGHLAGYAHEAEAGFVGWLTCVQGDAQARYSGWLALFPRLVLGLDRPMRQRALARLARGPRADLDAIEQRLRASVDPRFTRVAWASYDRFLKANRVESGVHSYDAVVSLVAGTAFERRWQPRLAGAAGGSAPARRGSARP